MIDIILLLPTLNSKEFSFERFLSSKEVGKIVCDSVSIERMGKWYGKKVASHGMWRICSVAQSLCG
jgi:hypothetical protein